MPTSTPPDWNTLPTVNIPVDRLVWPCHDINPRHLHDTGDTQLTTGPIHVQLLLDDHYFIHDGRHRAIRAKHRGDQTIAAKIHD